MGVLLLSELCNVQTVTDEFSRVDGVRKLDCMIATTSLKPCPLFGLYSYHPPISH